MIEDEIPHFVERAQSVRIAGRGARMRRRIDGEIFREPIEEVVPEKPEVAVKVDQRGTFAGLHHEGFDFAVPQREGLFGYLSHVSCFYRRPNPWPLPLKWKGTRDFCFLVMPRVFFFLTPLPL